MVYKYCWNIITSIYWFYCTSIIIIIKPIDETTPSTGEAKDNKTENYNEELPDNENEETQVKLLPDSAVNFFNKVLDTTAMVAGKIGVFLI